MSKNELARLNEEVIGKKVKLDVRDRNILSILSDNCRTPITHIAKAVRLSRDAVAYRIKRLEKKGIIKAFIPLLNLKALGFNKYHTFLLLDEKKKNRQKELIDFLKRHPSTRSVIEYSSRWDLELVSVARNVQEFDRMINEIMSQFSDVVHDNNKVLVIKNYYSVHLPYHFYMDFREPWPNIPSTFLGQEFDDHDLKIVEELTLNARESLYNIGESVGLSPDAVGYRIARMKERGIILRFTIIVDLTRIGYNWYAFIIKTDSLFGEIEKRFIEFTSRNPYIIRSVKTLGDMDLMLYIVTDSTHSFHNCVKDVKHEFGNIIKEYRIFPAFKEHIYIPFPARVKER